MFTYNDRMLQIHPFQLKEIVYKKLSLIINSTYRYFPSSSRFHPFQVRISLYAHRHRQLFSHLLDGYITYFEMETRRRRSCDYTVCLLTCEGSVSSIHPLSMSLNCKEIEMTSWLVVLLAGWLLLLLMNRFRVSHYVTTTTYSSYYILLNMHSSK